MKTILPQTDHYAVVKDGKLIGTVEKCNDTQWGYFPIEGTSVQFIPLRYALQEALRDK